MPGAAVLSTTGYPIASAAATASAAVAAARAATTGTP